jgi:hypothetical protein
VAMVARMAMPSEPPISWPVVLRPKSIPVSSSRAPQDDHELRDGQQQEKGRAVHGGEPPYLRH